MYADNIAVFIVEAKLNKYRVKYVDSGQSIVVEIKLGSPAANIGLKKRSHIW